MLLSNLTPAALLFAAVLAAPAAASGSSLPRSTPEAEGVDSGGVQRFVEALEKRIDAVHSRSDPPRLVEIEHLGSKGFFTRFTLTPEGDGVKAVMTTYLNAPPWPFRKYYYTEVRPIWVQCQIDALQALDAAAAK